MVTSTLLPIVLYGGSIVGMWSSDGTRLSVATRANPPQYFHVILPPCAANQRTIPLALHRGGKVKRYTVECSPDVYLEWNTTKPHREYRKVLIRR